MKYEKETLSQLDILQLATLSNIESNKAHDVVLMIFLANLGMATIPGLWIKLVCMVIGFGWLVYGAVVYVRLDRIGDELKKKYKERMRQSEKEGGKDENH